MSSRNQLLGLVGLLAHPAAWCIVVIAQTLRSRAKVDDWLEQVLGPTFWSWLIAGWITVPLGALAGFLLAWVLARRAPR